MKKLFFLFTILLSFFSLLFSQIPPPPQPIFIISDNPPTPDNANPLFSIPKTKPFFPYLILDCPSAFDESPCIFIINSISFTCHYPNNNFGPPVVIFSNQVQQTTQVPNGEREILTIGPNPGIFSILTNPFNALGCYDRQYANFSFNISTRRGNGPLFPIPKSYTFNINQSPPKIPNNPTILLCSFNFSLFDEDDKINQEKTKIMFNISNTTNTCTAYYHIKRSGLSSFIFPQDQTEICKAFIKSHTQTSHSGDDSFPLNISLNITLNRTFSPYTVSLSPFNEYIQSLFNISGSNTRLSLSCREEKTYSLSGSANILSDKMEILTIATTNNLFNNDFNKKLEVNVTSSKGTKSSYTFNWKCSSANCQFANFTPSQNAQNLIIFNSSSVSPTTFSNLLELDTQKLCPEADQNNVSINLFSYGIGWETKEIKIYEGICTGKKYFNANIYSSKTSQGKEIPLELSSSNQNMEKFIIVELTNFQNILSPPILNITYQLFSQDKNQSNSKQFVLDSNPNTYYIPIYYDIQLINVSIYVENGPIYYRAFSFPLPRPKPLLDEWKINQKNLDSEQKDDLIKNKRIYVGYQEDVEIVLVFEAPYGIENYDFNVFLNRFSNSECSSTPTKIQKNKLIDTVKLKKGACQYKIRGKSKSGSFSDFLSYVIYSKNFFVPQKPQSFCDLNSILSASYYKMLAIALASLLIIIGIAYMVGSFFLHPHLLEWSKREIVEVFLLGFFIILLPQFLSFSCSEKMTIGPFTVLFPLENKLTESSAPILDFAQSTMLDIIDRVHTTIIILRRDISYFHILGSFYRFESDAFTEILGLLVGFSKGYNVNPYSGVYSQLGLLTFLIQLNNLYLFNILTHYFLLFFLSSSPGLIAFLLPLGLLFRCLPFFKNVGSALIAIGLGFYFIFPLAYVFYGIILNNPSFSHYTFCAVFSDDENCKTKEKKLYPIGWENFKEKKMNYIISLIDVGDFTKETFPDEESIISTGKNKETLQPVYPSSDESFDINSAKYFGLSALNFILALFIPSIILLITLSFIRDLASILGGDIDVSRLMYLT